MNLHLVFAAQRLSSLNRGIKVLSCIFFCLFVFTPGCKKSGGSGSGNGNNSPYYIKFKADGVQKNYSVYSEADTNKIIGPYNLEFAAVATNFNESMAVDLFSVKYFSTGESFVADYIPGSGIVQMVIAYIPDVKNATTKSYSTFAPLVTPLSQGQAKITELTATTVRGTFSASTVLQSSVTGTGSATAGPVLTDGEFYVKIHTK